MLWIIDGYNLMHQWSPLPKTHRSSAFQRHRQKFLDWLTDQRARYCPEDQLEVVFDAVEAPRVSKPQLYKGLHVFYAHKMHADHWIEERLVSLCNRQAVTVVSSDHQVQRIAQRRGVRWMECDVFLERWSREPPGTTSSAIPPSSRSSPPLEDDKKISLSCGEQAELLQVFRQRPVQRPRRRTLPRKPPSRW
jgi:predicted RNA-binding protein with PIN domain